MKLIGPFSQIITLHDAPLKGALKNELLGIIENGGVLIDKGKVIGIGKFTELKDKAIEIDYQDTDCCVFPGFIDCHTHLIWGGSRAADFERRNSGFSYQQILEEGGGIYDTVKKTQSASDQELIRGLGLRLKRHLSDGITTVEVKTGYGLSTDQEVRMLRIINQVKSTVVNDIIPTFLGAHMCPSGMDKTEYLRKLADDVFPVISEEKLASRLDAFIEKEAFPIEVARPYLLKGKQCGFDITLHAGQFSPEGVHLAIELEASSADHLETISEKEIELLANGNTVAVALPGASIGLGMDFTPARKILNGGGSLAVSTDWNPGSAPQGDLLTQVALISTYEKLTSAEAYAAITFRAAKALGLHDRGRIRNGLIADLAVFPTGDYREVLYQMGQMKPTSVYKNGIKQ